MKGKRGRRAFHTQPDDVFTVRLSRDYETEQKALSVFESWAKRGEEYTPRYIVTCALLALAGYDIPPAPPKPIDLSAFLNNLNEEVESLRSIVGNIHTTAKQSPLPSFEVEDIRVASKQKNLPTNYLKNLTQRINKGE